MKKLILIVGLLFSSSICHAGNIGSGTIGPTVSFIGIPQVSANTVTGATGWFDNLYLNGVSSTSVFWTTSTDQTLLTGDKSGSFDLNTTGKGTFGSFDITGLTDGYLPYVGVGALANSPIYTDGTNVGIGTSSPHANTHIFAGSSGAVSFNSETIMFLEGAATNKFLTFLHPSTSTDYNGIAWANNADAFIANIGYKHSDSSFRIYSNNATRLTIDSAGNFGIGTTDLDGTPAVGRLTVKGTTNDGSTNILVLRDSDEVNVASVDTDGNLTTIPSNSTIKAGTLITTDTTRVLAMNLINNAKSELIEDINQLVGTSDIKGFWIFDQTGATTSITGRDPDGTVCTLGGNASTLSPAVSGLCPNLTMNGTAATAWSVADANKYSFGDGAGNDSAFTVIALVNPVDLTTCRLLLKGNTNLWEWLLDTTAADKIEFGVLVNNASAYILRSYNTAITSDEGSWHVYCGTANGGSPQAIGGLKLYRDGTQIDDTNTIVGTYSGMTNNTSVVANSRNNASEWSKAKYGVVLIISKELTEAEVLRVSNRLRAYSGAFL